MNNLLKRVVVKINDAKNAAAERKVIVADEWGCAADSALFYGEYIYYHHDRKVVKMVQKEMKHRPGMVETYRCGNTLLIKRHKISIKDKMSLIFEIINEKLKGMKKS